MIHEDIVEEDDEAEAGVESSDRIEFAVDYIRYGHFGEVPETIHEKAFHLMRLIASNHWFVDGNKRTALNSTELFYMVNGYELDYGEDIRSMLKLFSVREDVIDRETGPKYLKDQVESPAPDETELLSGMIVIVAVVLAKYLDIDLEEYIEESPGLESVRRIWGLTTFEEDGTINKGEDQEPENNGG